MCVCVRISGSFKRKLAEQGKKGKKIYGKGKLCRVRKIVYFFTARERVLDLLSTSSPPTPSPNENNYNYKHQQKTCSFLVREGSRASWLTYLGQENCVNGFGRSEREKEKYFFLLSQSTEENYKSKLMVKWGKIDENFFLLLRLRKFLSFGFRKKSVAKVFLAVFALQTSIKP